ncbi:MAG: hypothetical protein FJZ01_15020 [Candidatus Sericytochromatia bacterium]|nr:hypothetical protein [Candidatus Tanganyikabacteria bacterium]
MKALRSLVWLVALLAAPLGCALLPVFSGTGGPEQSRAPAGFRPVLRY